ncbi:hypothetical protein [Luteitalea sp.]|uniref:hypothetical protein n=1 Tax=Luteitalea sp. TaxID=2004800 RepID=UPI0025C58705|nr:hypothetical protein [Luteitalea sp.]
MALEQDKFLGLAGATGAVSFRTDVPTSVVRTRYVGACQYEPSTSTFPDYLGPMSVGDDGAVYFQLYNQSVDWTISDCPPGQASTGVFSYTTDLFLARLAADGALTKQLIYRYVQPPTSTSDGGATQRISQPGPSTPDGQGGILASWDLYTFSSNPTTLEAHVTRVSSAIDDHVVAPRFGPGGPPPNLFTNSPLAFVGDNGTAYLQDPSGVTALNAATWTTVWSSPDQGKVVAAHQDGGATLLRSDGMLQKRDAQGVATNLGMLGVSDPVQTRLGLWSGMANGVLTSVWGPAVSESVFAFDAALDPGDGVPSGSCSGGWCG